MRVGTKDLKNRLSHYLRLVREGEHVQVSDRGKVIAEIRPVEPERDADDAVLRRLAARGVVTLGQGKLEDFEPIRLSRGRRLSDIVVADRRR